MKHEQTRSKYENLGRYLLAAVIAHRRGISLDYAWRHYVKNKMIHESWATVGQHLDQAIANRLGAQIAQANKPRFVQ